MGSNGNFRPAAKRPTSQLRQSLQKSCTLLGSGPRPCAAPPAAPRVAPTSTRPISAIVSPDAQVANAVTRRHQHPVGAWLGPADNITGGPMPGHRPGGSRTTPPSAQAADVGQGMRSRCIWSFSQAEPTRSSVSMRRSDQLLPATGNEHERDTPDGHDQGHRAAPDAHVVALLRASPADQRPAPTSSARPLRRPRDTVAAPRVARHRQQRHHRSHVGCGRSHGVPARCRGRS